MDFKQNTDYIEKNIEYSINNKKRQNKKELYKNSKENYTIVIK
jgi:hypothetical protein